MCVFICGSDVSYKKFLFYRFIIITSKKGSRKKSYFFNGRAIKRGGVRGRPLRKDNFFGIFFVLFCCHLMLRGPLSSRGGGAKALTLKGRGGYVTNEKDKYFVSSKRLGLNCLN